MFVLAGFISACRPRDLHQTLIRLVSSRPTSPSGAQMCANFDRNVSSKCVEKEKASGTKNPAFSYQRPVIGSRHLIRPLPSHCSGSTIIYVNT